MERQDNELLYAEIIEHSTSTWGAQALLVEKVDGSYRFAIDYSDFNRLTRVDPYPLPNILETLSELGSAKFLMVMDMPSGYWQIEMHEHDKERLHSIRLRGITSGDACLWASETAQQYGNAQHILSSPVFWGTCVMYIWRTSSCTAAIKARMALSQEF